jgi:AAA domain
MSALLPPSAPPLLAGYRELSPADLRGAAPAQQEWLWDGYLAPGNVTLLTSQWKSGKTTLLAVLLERLRAGGPLAGRPVRPGTAVVVSEESPAHWAQRCRKFAFGDHVRWVCRPFVGKPHPEEWLALLDRLAALRTERGLDLVVIDPLAAFLPGRDENSAAGMLEALLPLQRLTTLGLSVLVLHHPRKRESAGGQAARGSGALPGYVDVLIEMRWCGPGTDGDRRRLLEAWSRHEETPRQVVIELNPEGTDYAVLGDLPQVELNQTRRGLLAVLSAADRKLTRVEILEGWPEQVPVPSKVSLWRWVAKAVAQAEVCQEGSARRNDPFRYWLPGQEAKWAKDNVLPALPELPELPELGDLDRAGAVLEELLRRNRERR